MIQSFISSMIGYCIITLPFYILFRFLIIRKQKLRIMREFLMLLFFFYCVSIFSQTIIPRFYIMNGALVFDFERGMGFANLIPFHTISHYIELLKGPFASIAFYNLAGNIILFIPFGYFLPYLWKRCRSLLAALLISLLIPLFIEGTQYFIGRSVDIDDVILNAIAIFFGYLLWYMYNKCIKFRHNK